MVIFVETIAFIQLSDSSTDIVLLRLSINNKLQQPQAAHGVLVYAMKNHGADVVSIPTNSWLKRHRESARAYKHQDIVSV